jgi:hypothetical protein
MLKRRYAAVECTAVECTAVKLTDLPPEILTDIMDFLVTTELSACSMTSHGMRVAARGVPLDLLYAGRSIMFTLRQLYQLQGWPIKSLVVDSDPEQRCTLSPNGFVNTLEQLMVWKHEVFVYKLNDILKGIPFDSLSCLRCFYANGTSLQSVDIQCAPLKWLHLPNSRRLSEVVSLPIELRALTLTHAPLTNFDFLNRLEHLDNLNLSNCPELRDLNGLPGLKYLDISYTGVTVLPTLSEIEELVVCGCPLTTLEPLRDSHKLHILTINFCTRLPFAEDGLDFLRDCPLTKFSAIGTHFSDRPDLWPIYPYQVEDRLH